MLSRKTDILIVGGGLAGLQTAITISETSPKTKVMICDLGGSASTEIMGFCAPVLEDDSVDCFTDDIIRSGSGENDPELARVLAEGSLQVVHDLEQIGIQFDREANGRYSLVHSVGSSYPRVVHYKTITGKTVVNKYRALLDKNSNVTFLKSRIVKLFKSENRICGALGFNEGIAEAYSAKAVVLCTGGGAGLFGFSSWTKMLKGSGYAMAQDVGAELTGMRRIQYEPCVTVYPKELYGFPIITTTLFDGARLLDGKGNDLLAGRTPPPKRELAELINKAINSGNDCGNGGIWFDFSEVSENMFKSKYPEYYRKLRPLVDDYSELKLEVKPAAHTTLGGVSINEKAETSVPGLFVAGECAGGIHGRDRIGGNAGLEVFVFGKIAGKNSLDYIKNNTFTNMDNKVMSEFYDLRTGSGQIVEYLTKIGAILEQYCQLDRDKKNLQTGLEKLKMIYDVFRSNPPVSIEDIYICNHALYVASLFLN